MTDSEKIDILQCCEKGELFEYVEKYLEKCAGGEKFPNVAGFCRFCGVGQGELNELEKIYPKEYDALCSVFEDEALNSDIAVSLVGAYMKKRLGYGDEKRAESSSPPEIIFEHDILRDGE